MADFQTVSRRGPKGAQNVVKYAAQQQQLMDMGFNEKIVQNALELTGGDLEKAMALVLGDLTREEVVSAAQERFEEKPVEKVVEKRQSTRGGRRGTALSTGSSSPAPAAVPSPVASNEQPKELPAHKKMMSTYKTLRCRETGNPTHDRKDCIYWHTYADRRRNPYEVKYSPYECPKTVGGLHCPDGDACLHAHNMLERMFHPELFKISPCQRSADGKTCERGAVCAFSHGAADHRVSPSKTFPSLAFEAPSKPSTTELVVSEELLQKLVELVQSFGEEGVHINDVYKKYSLKFGELLPLEDMYAGKYKIRQVLDAHPNVKSVFTRGNQPVFVYVDETATTSTTTTEAATKDEEEKPATPAVAASAAPVAAVAPETSSSTSAAPSSRVPEVLRDRIAQILLKAGPEGVLGSELPKKYNEIYGEKLESKLKLKDILQSVPGVVTSAANKSQPKFTLDPAVAATMTIVPPAVPTAAAAAAVVAAAVEKPKAKTWSAIAAAADKPKPVPVAPPAPTPAPTADDVSAEPAATASTERPAQQPKKEKSKRSKETKETKETKESAQSKEAEVALPAAAAAKAKPTMKSFAAVVASTPAPPAVAAPVQEEKQPEPAAVEPEAAKEKEEPVAEPVVETQVAEEEINKEDEEAAAASASAVEVSTSVVEEILAAVPGEPSPVSLPPMPVAVELPSPPMVHSAPPNLSLSTETTQTMSKVVPNVSFSDGPVSLPPLLGAESSLSSSLLFGIGTDKKDDLSSQSHPSKFHELLYKAASRPDHSIMPPGLTKQPKVEPLNNVAGKATSEQEELARKLSQAQNQISSLQEQINAMQKEMNTRKADYDSQSQLLKSTQQKLKDVESRGEDFPKQLAKKEEEFHAYLQHYQEDFKCQNQERMLELSQATQFFSNIEFAIVQAKVDEINIDTATKEQIAEVLKLLPSIRDYCAGCKQQYKYKSDMQNSRAPTLFADPYASTLSNRTYPVQYPAQTVYDQSHFSSSQFPVNNYAGTYPAPQQCNFPGCHAAGVYQCTGCYRALYCSQDHQTMHYPQHAAFCHH